MDSVFFCRKCGSVVGSNRHTQNFQTVISGKLHEPELDFFDDYNFGDPGEDVCSECGNDTNLWVDLTGCTIQEVEDFLNEDDNKKRLQMWEAFKVAGKVME